MAKTVAQLSNIRKLFRGFAVTQLRGIAKYNKDEDFRKAAQRELSKRHKKGTKQNSSVKSELKRRTRARATAIRSARRNPAYGLYRNGRFLRILTVNEDPKHVVKFYRETQPAQKWIIRQLKPGSIIPAKRNPSQVATVVARGNKKVFVVATDSSETNDALLTRVNAVRVIKRVNTNPKRETIWAHTSSAVPGGAKEEKARLSKLYFDAGKRIAQEGNFSSSKIAFCILFTQTPWRKDKRVGFTRNDAEKAFTAGYRAKTNPQPLTEWEFEDLADEGARLGSQAARAIGISQRKATREAAKEPRRYNVTWYSPRLGKRTGFIRPIEADTSAEAKKQAKAMITNDPKASNFIAKETRRNPRRNGIAEIAAGLQAAEYLGGKVKLQKARPIRVNPSLREMSERFNGRATGSVTKLKISDCAPSDLSRAGKLIFLKLASSRKQLRIPGAVVCIDPKTEKLWIAGNRTPLLNRKAKPGELLEWDTITDICYETAKAHIENGEMTEYTHEFETPKPKLRIDHDGMPIIHGGGYKIRSEGITG